MYVSNLSGDISACLQKNSSYRRANLSQKETGDDTATYETLFVAAFTTQGLYEWEEKHLFSTKDK